MAKKKETLEEGTFPNGFFFGATIASTYLGSSYATLFPRPMRDAGAHTFPLAVSLNNPASGIFFAQSFDHLRKFGLNSVHLHLPWKAMQSAPETLDNETLLRCKACLDALRDREITVLLTLGDTAPPFLKGGWANPDSVKSFSHYAKGIAEILEGMPVHCAPYRISHPAIPPLDAPTLQGSYLPFQLARQRRHQKEAHIRACDILSAANPNAIFGLHLDVAQCVPQDMRSAWDLRTARRIMREMQLETLGGLEGNFSFLALSPVNRFKCSFSLFRPGHSFAALTPEFSSLENTEQCGSAVSAFQDAITAFSGVSSPIYLTNWGLPTDDDVLRQRFIAQSLDAVLEKRAQGMNICAYFHRSWMDEPQDSSSAMLRTGLLHVDASSAVQTPNPSAFMYGDMARQRRISKAAREKFGMDSKKGGAKP